MASVMVLSIHIVDITYSDVIAVCLEGEVSVFLYVVSILSRRSYLVIDILSLS